MRKKIQLSLLLLAVSLSSAAEAYKVIAIKNCAPTYDDAALTVGMTITDPKKLKENWGTASGSKYIKLQNLADKAIMVVTQPVATKKKEEQGFFSWMWSCFSGQKKCSTRAPQDELSGGLAANMNQTFYVLMPADSAEVSSFAFASGLPAGSHLRCSYRLQGDARGFEVPLRDGKFEFTSRMFPTPKADRTALKVNVNYISPDGKETPLTNSMNVILIPE